MRRELQEIEVIEKYLMGNMNPEEKSNFEKELSSNPNLKDKVEQQQSLMLGLERMGLKADLNKAKSRSKLIKGAKVLAVYVSVLSGIAALWLASTYYNASKEFEKIEEQEIQEFELDEPIQTDSLILFEPLDTITPSEEQPKTDVVNKNSLSLPQKEFQYFTIDPTQANTIRGKEGTLIEIEANSFDTKSKEEITVKLKEYYKMSDIVYSSLTTETTDGQLLETGGMIFLEASNKSQGNLKLNPEKPIGIQLPYETKKKGMKLFTGKKTANKVVWEEEAIDELKALPISVKQEAAIGFEESAIFTLVEDMPALPGCEDLSRDEKQQCAQIKTMEFIENNLAKFYNGPKNQSGSLYVSFTINELGWVEDVNVLNSTNSRMDEAAILCVKSLPQFIPGKQRGKAVSVQYNIPIKYRSEGNSTTSWSRQRTRQYSDSLNALIKQRKKDVLAMKEQSREKALDMILDSSASPDNAVNSTIKQSNLDYYVLSSSNLGWINCDRFGNDRREKVTLAVRETDQNASVKLIFHSIASVMKSSYSRSRYTFAKVPRGEKVSVFATKVVDGQLYLALQETKVSQGSLSLTYEKATKERIEEISQTLNTLN